MRDTVGVLLFDSMSAFPAAKIPSSPVPSVPLRGGCSVAPISSFYKIEVEGLRE